jgi:fibronectin-binding autotransporter adhesin
MKTLPYIRLLSGVFLSTLCLAVTPSARANDWVSSGGGAWNDPLNWDLGVPNNAGGWAIGNINNGGTAIITNTVPNVSEAWAGNSGAAGNIIVTNGGTLPVDNWLVIGRTGTGGNTPLSTLIVSSGGVINKRGDGFIVGDGTFCSGQIFVTGNGQINVTGGWNGIGNGDGGQGWITLQDNAVFNTSGYDFNVGDWGSGRGFAVVKDNATLNVSRFWVGKTDSTLGVLTQTGGAIVGTGVNANEWCIGGENDTSTDSYGFYNLSGGTFSNPSNFQIGRYGKGLLYQSGGTLTQGSWCSVGRFTTAQGILYITGGQFIHTGTGQSLMVAEGGSRGEMTIAGTGSVTTSREFAIGNGGTGFLNLNGGTLTVPRVARWGGTGFLNFNGGTLKPTVADPAFMGGLTEARVYSGNAVIDTAGLDIGISQPLLAAYGQGVSSIPVADGGAGYVAPPIVQINGDGFGAQAIAQVDSVAGTVTSIVITCPGSGYSTVDSVTFVGGGSSIAATAGTPVLGTVTSGGLIKNGAGTLTLSGANEYAGATVVNGGGLALNTTSTGNGAITLADGTALSVQVANFGGQIFPANITLGTSAATTLNLDLGSFGNPVAPPLSTTGTLAVNGTVTVNISDDLPQVGTVPLIHYLTRTGAGTFVLGPLPTGVTANIQTNIAGKTIVLVITAVAAPRWNGQLSGAWDVNQTQNWTELSTGLPSYYNDGLVALFDDAALGTTTVDLVTTVQPGGVVVSNANLAYSFTGTGKISGATGLTKRGPNTLTIANQNDYTGPTVISGGTVSVANLANGGQPSAIGKSSAAASNLVLAGGILSYTGPAVRIDRGYSVQAASSTVDALSDLSLGGNVTATANTSFVKTGPAKLAYVGAVVNELSGGAFPGYNVLDGTVVFDGSSGKQVNHSQNEFWVGSTPNADAALVLTNTTLNVDSWVAVGRGNGSDNHLSSLTLYDSALRSGSFSMGYDNGLAGNLAQQVFTLNGSSTFTNNGDVNVGESGGSTATLLMKGNSKFYSNGRTHFGWHNNATCIATIADSAAMTVNAWFSTGHEGGVGDFTVKDNGSLWVLWDLNVTDVGLGQGTFNLQNNATVTANNFFIGKGIGSTGLFNQTGGSAIGRLNDGNEIHIGFHGEGTWNLSAGSILAPNHWLVVGRYTDGPGTLNVTGGTIIHGTNNTGKLFRVGEEGTGILNLSGTGVIVSGGDAVTVGSVATGNGTINLNGGSLEARRIIGGPGFSTFNFNGGVLRAGPNANPDFISALNSVNVNAGGAVIDAGGNWIAINQDLLAGNGNGGLTKQGGGTLALNGNNTYLGSTIVKAGALGGAGTIASPVTVQAGGTLSPGSTNIGALTINNALNLAGTTVMRVDGTAGTSDQVLGVTTLTYGGTLMLTNVTGLPTVGASYKLFTAGTYAGTFTSIVSANPGITYDTSKLTVDGTVKVVSLVSTTPISIQTSNSTGGLMLTWPADHIGWELQAQTNAITIGLSTNWVVVPGSTTTNQVTLPIDRANGTVFLRLVLP